MFVGAISSIVTIVIPVVLIVWAVRRFGDRSESGWADGHSVRRFFHYLLLYALMVVAATGLSGLLGLLFHAPVVAGDDRSALARGLTFSVFGIPMFVLLAAWSKRRLQRDPDESRSIGWACYVTITPLTALIVAMTSLHSVVSAAAGGRRLDWPALAQFAVWFLVWLVHWIVAKRMLDATRRQAQLALGSVIGLGVCVAGLITLLAASLETLLLDETGTLLAEQEPALARAAATLVVGAPVWAGYWLATFAKVPRTPLWFGYVLPVGVGGSLVLAVAGASTALYQLLVWLVGDPASTQAAQHFGSTPTAAACAVVGAVSWWYHRQVLAAATPERTEITRVYDYLMTGIALLAAGTGVATVVAALLESLIAEAALGVGTSPLNSLLSGSTLLVVGGPLWWIFWSGVDRATRADSRAELASPVRRTFLFVLFGIGGVIAVLGVLVAAFLGIQGALQGGVDADVLRDMQVPVAILLATGAISGYHWAVYRRDRSRLPVSTPRPGPRYVLLVGAADEHVGGAIERRTGARVDLWVRADGLAEPWGVDEVVDAVNGSQADAVAVIAGPAGLETVGMHRR